MDHDPSSIDDDADRPARAADRPGDPLDGLWHWTDHPAVRIGIALAIMGATLIIFPLLAQWAF